MSEAGGIGRKVWLPDSGVIGGYHILDIFISGAMTTFLRADGEEGGLYAVEVPSRDSRMDRTLLLRFEREMEILRQLTGPAFPTLRKCGNYDTPEQRGIPFIVTDFPTGQLLEDVLNDRLMTRSPPDLSGGIRLLHRLGQALIEAHARGIVHRNLKPQKITVTPEGEVQILDFVLGLGTNHSFQTAGKVFLGTPTYAAPEQARDSHNVDSRADLYSIGMIVYQYVTHNYPFGAPAEDVKDALKQMHKEAEPPSTHNPDVPPQLDGILCKLLEGQPGRRYQRASDLVSDIEWHFPWTASNGQ